MRSVWNFSGSRLKFILGFRSTNLCAMPIMGIRLSSCEDMPWLNQPMKS
jgi:hypothetical protein